MVLSLVLKFLGKFHKRDPEPEYKRYDTDKDIDDCCHSDLYNNGAISCEYDGCNNCPVGMTPDNCNVICPLMKND